MVSLSTQNRNLYANQELDYGILMMEGGRLMRRDKRQVRRCEIVRKNEQKKL